VSPIALPLFPKPTLDNASFYILFISFSPTSENKTADIEGADSLSMATGKLREGPGGHFPALLPLCVVLCFVTSHN
jgi:hypothetical protein